jgi:DNA-binding transcriptional ArsR family regulator
MAFERKGVLGMGRPTDDEGKEEEPSKGREPGEVEYVDGDVAKAMAHPLRVQILAALNKRVMSPTMFSKEFKEKLQNVSYHFRILKEYGLIEEVDSRPVRGATEHFYTATRRVLFDGKAWDSLPDSLKKEVSAQAFGDFLEAVSLAMDGETFDGRNDRVNVWMQRRLDKQGWEEAVKAHWVLIHAMEDVFKRARLRLLKAGEPEGGMLGTYGLFLFESPPPPEEDEDEE